MLKLVIVLVILAALIAPMFIKGPDGKPLMSLDDWKVDVPGDVGELLPDGAAEPAGPETTTVYKWQDENGQWHFSNTPQDMANAETMELSSDINIMDAVAIPEDEPAKPQQTGVGAQAGVMTASPEQVKEMMETVTNLQETVDQRKADMDAMAGLDDN